MLAGAPVQPPQAVADEQAAVGTPSGLESEASAAVVINNSDTEEASSDVQVAPPSLVSEPSVAVDSDTEIGDSNLMEAVKKMEISIGRSSLKDSTATIPTVFILFTLLLVYRQ